MPRTDLNYLMDWDGDDIKEMVRQFADDDPEIFENTWNEVCSTCYLEKKKKPDYQKLLKKLNYRKVPENLAKFAIHYAFLGGNVNSMLYNDGDPDEVKDIEKCMADWIEDLCFIWSIDPNRTWDTIYMCLRTGWHYLD
jgi:hypothetical protein